MGCASSKAETKTLVLTTKHFALVTHYCVI